MTEQVFLFTLVAGSVLLFGAVESWSFALAGLYAVIFFNLRYIRLTVSGGSSGPIPLKDAPGWLKGIVFSIAGFFLLCIFQLLPLPGFVVGVLSPSAPRLLAGTELYGYASRISLDYSETLNGLIYMGVYLIVFLTAFSMNTSRRRIYKTIRALVVFGFVLAVFAIIQKSNWNGRIYWFRHIPGVAAPFGPFVNRNHFAGFVGMLIPLGLGIVSEMKGSEKRLLYLFMTVIMAVGVVLSLSRGGILSMLASLAFFSALVFMRKQRGKKPVFYIWLFFSVFLLYAFYMGAGPFLERLSSEGVTDKLRLAAWKGTLGAYRDFWLLGTGLSTFRDVFPAYDQGLKAFFQYAHNDYLQLIMETGSLGGALALWFLISLSRGTARLYRLQKASYISIGIAASIFYMLVHSFFDFNLHIPSNAITFSMLLGFMAAFVYKEELYLDGKRRLYFSANGVDQIP